LPITLSDHLAVYNRRQFSDTITPIKLCEEQSVKQVQATADVQTAVTTVLECMSEDIL